MNVLLLQLVLSQVVMNPESDSLYQPGTDDGSGSGFMPISTDDQLTDDEDSEPDGREQGSGSGEVPITADRSGKNFDMLSVPSINLPFRVR